MVVFSDGKFSSGLSLVLEFPDNCISGENISVVMSRFVSDQFFVLFTSRLLFGLKLV